jgi:hypothetical protein
MKTMDIHGLVKYRSILLIWLGWVLVMLGYQTYVRARFAPLRPDHALSWTPSETQARSQNDKPYLMEPFLNAHVSWDSEYYLSIAVSGYDDPSMRAIPADYTWSNPLVSTNKQQPTWVSMNYAFFPFYPLMIRWGRCSPSMNWQRIPTGKPVDGGQLSIY